VRDERRQRAHRRIAAMHRLAACFALLLLAAPAHAGETERLAELLAVRPAAAVADVGAGDGRFALELAARVGPSGRVYATELGAEAREEIRAAAAKAGLANLEVVEAEIAATGLPSACCDAILLRHVYHHLTEPAALNRDLARALAPGGVLVIVDFPPTWYLRPFTPDGVGAERAQHGIAPADALRELHAAGFEEVHVIDPWTNAWIGPDSYALVLRRAGAPEETKP
jgi:ubiquinone/menaquinone biosynthesis C-methylase UbiE